jgi:hypothetical protein
MNTTTPAEMDGEVSSSGEKLSSSSDMSEPSLVQQPSIAAAQQQEDEEDHTATATAAAIPLSKSRQELSGTAAAAATTTIKKSTVVVPTKKFALVVRILRWYVRFSGSALNQDKILKVLQYSLKVWFSHQAWPQRIANEITMARYVTRLVGWPVALEAAWNDSWAVVVPHPSSLSATTTTTITRAILHKWLGRILAYSMTVYYPTEHLAYALWMKPPMNTAAAAGKQTTAGGIGTWRAETWSYLSNRCWLLYIIAEMVQSALQLQDETSSSDPVAVANTQLSLARSALMVLPCLHWSRSDWDTAPFFIKNETINLLLWTESIVCIYQAWRNSWE